MTALTLCNITMLMQYLVEAYENRVAETEKKKLVTSIPMDEELKLKVCLSKREWGASWCEQYSILFWRGLKERRHDYFSWLRITQVLTTATILGMLWWQSGSNNPKELQDQVCKAEKLIYQFKESRNLLVPRDKQC